MPPLLVCSSKSLDEVLARVDSLILFLLLCSKCTRNGLDEASLIGIAKVPMVQLDQFKPIIVEHINTYAIL